MQPYLHTHSLLDKANRIQIASYNEGAPKNPYECRFASAVSASRPRRGLSSSSYLVYYYIYIYIYIYYCLSYFILLYPIIILYCPILCIILFCILLFIFPEMNNLKYDKTTRESNNIRLTQTNNDHNKKIGKHKYETSGASRARAGAASLLSLVSLLSLLSLLYVLFHYYVDVINIIIIIITIMIIINITIMI